MKFNSTIKLIILGFVCALLATSCVKEGPMGLAGINGDDGADGAPGSDGQNGVDGNVTCLVCHSGENMLNKQAQYVLSGHKIGKFTLEREEWGASCGRCHTPTGFQQFAEQGADAIYGNIQNAETFDCNTCHGIHVTFEATDYALRTSGAVVPAYSTGPALELGGNNNLCGQCHQNRRAEPNIDKPGETYRITSSHYGPHHGPQGNVVAGVGFAEIPGPANYPAAGTAIHLAQASCTGCHMGEFNNTKNQGGHSFAPSLNACNTCHNASNEDFDYKSVQSETQLLLEELRDKLVALGVVVAEEEIEYEWDEELQDHVASDPVISYHPHTGTYPMVQVQAFFNWVGLEEDRSLGVHNPAYVRALLVNSISALE